MIVINFSQIPWASLVTQMVKTACNTGGLGLIPGLGRSPGKRNSNPLRYSYLENPMGRGAWQAIVHGIAKSWTMKVHFLKRVNISNDSS